MIEPVTQPGVLATLGINAPLFIAQLVNFSVVMLVVWRFIYKPLIKIMDAREKRIADGLLHADQAKRNLADAEATQEAMLKKAHIESQKMIDEAKSAAEKERQTVMVQTQQDLERQLAEAKERLKREKEAMLTAIRNEVTDLVMDATKKVAVESSSPEAQRKLIGQALGQIENV